MTKWNVTPLIVTVSILTGLPPVAQATENCNTRVTATTPDSRFTVNADGTVTDKATGLMWKQCSEGLSGADCTTGTLEKVEWPDALRLAETLNNNSGFAGYTDWRLPNVNELNSIVELQCAKPAINATVFPETDFDEYWSASQAGGFSAWVVSFFHGYVSTPTTQRVLNSVRLVRGGQ